MRNKSQLKFIALFLFGLCFQIALPALSQTPQAQKKKLAALKITYADFTKEEQDMVNTAFYEHLALDQGITVMTEAQARAELFPLGIEPAEINDEASYIHAGQVLRVDYVLVGNMEKVGDFVEVTFRVFTMPRGIPRKEYPGGKTLDLFVKQEIPKIVELIQRDLEPSPQIIQPLTQPDTVQVALPKPPAQKEMAEEKKASKRRKWPWIAIGGAAAGGAVAAVLLSTSGNRIEPPRGLPRPPAAP